LRGNLWLIALAALLRRIRTTSFARIADAGHWLHAEQPNAFLAIVEPFLAG
jgi:pimeloyl-ACP methyl ester carboxylesterase